MKTLEGRPLSDGEVAEALREQGTSSIEEIPADTEVTVGTWDEILADLDRREREIRKQRRR